MKFSTPGYLQSAFWLFLTAFFPVLNSANIKKWA